MSVLTTQLKSVYAHGVSGIVFSDLITDILLIQLLSPTGHSRHMQFLGDTSIHSEIAFFLGLLFSNNFLLLMNKFVQNREEPEAVKFRMSRSTFVKQRM